jgi:hypothetical protein
MEDVIEGKIIRKRDLALLREARKYGLICCAVARNGMVLAVGTQSLLETCSLPERVFFIDEVLTWEPVSCAL